MSEPMVGSKIPVNINVDGLGDNISLKSASVDIKATFFCERVLEYGEAQNTVTYTKADMTPAYDDEECNDYICIVDTTDLGYGWLCGAIEVTYPYNGKTVKEILRTKSDTRIMQMEV